MVIDHANRNRLDNRKENLRHATHSQNSINRVHRTVSGYRGVRVKGNRWEAQTANFKLGSFSTVEHAAAAYNWAALQLYGEFAVLNANENGAVWIPIKPEAAVVLKIGKLVALKSRSAPHRRWSYKRPVRREVGDLIRTEEGYRLKREGKLSIPLGTKNLKLAQWRADYMQHW